MLLSSLCKMNGLGTDILRIQESIRIIFAPLVPCSLMTLLNFDTYLILFALEPGSPCQLVRLKKFSGAKLTIALILLVTFAKLKLMDCNPWALLTAMKRKMACGPGGCHMSLLVCLSRLPLSQEVMRRKGRNLLFHHLLDPVDPMIADQLGQSLDEFVDV